MKTGWKTLIKIWFFSFHWIKFKRILSLGPVVAFSDFSVIFLGNQQKDVNWEKLIHAGKCIVSSFLEILFEFQTIQSQERNYVFNKTGKKLSSYISVFIGLREFKTTANRACQRMYWFRNPRTVPPANRNWRRGRKKNRKRLFCFMSSRHHVSWMHY